MSTFAKIDSEDTTYAHFETSYHGITSELQRLYFSSSYYYSSYQNIASSYMNYLEKGEWDSSEDKTIFQNSNQYSNLYKDFLFSSDNFPLLIHATSANVLSIKTEKLMQDTSKEVFSEDHENIYPIAIRYITNNGWYFIERPPFQVNVDLKLAPGSSRSTNRLSSFKVWVPWTISVINPKVTSSFRIFFSDSPLSSLDSVYLPTFLPNSYEDGSICFSNSLRSYDINDISHTDIKRLYSIMFNEYVSGGWNLDLTGNIHRYTTLINRIDQRLSEEDKTSSSIYKFLNVSLDQIKKVIPHLSNNKIQNLISQNFLNSFTNELPYMLVAMSTLTLEETLDFYRQIIQSMTPDYFPNSSFRSIVDRVKDNSTHSFVSPYTSFPVNFYSKYINENIHSSYSYRKFSIIISDILPLMSDDSKVLLIRNNLTNVLSSHVPYQNLSKLLNFINNLDTQNFNEDKYVILFSASTGDIEYFNLDSSTSIENFYVEYLKKNHLLKEVVPACL